MKPLRILSTGLTTLALLIFCAALASASPPVRNTEAIIVTDFITAADGVLDSPDDPLYDLDPCDPEQPDAHSPVLAPDGHHLTWGEYNQARGRALIKCTEKGTLVTIQLSGLIPNGVYTIWVLTFEAPGFTPDFAHLIGEGSLGKPDGSQSRFVASAAGTDAISVLHPAGPLSIGGEVGCLLDEFEFHLVGAYHPDGQTYGPTPGPADAPNLFCYFTEHFAFEFKSAAAAASVQTSGGQSRGLIGCTDPRGCPDLIVDEYWLGRQIHFENKKFTEEDCAVVEGMTVPGKRRLLRFTFSSPNLGPGALIVGAPADHPDVFEFSPCHGHYHFKEYADYRLWTPQGYAAWRTLREGTHPNILSGDLLDRNPAIKAQMIAGAKRGFCVVDFWPYDGVEQQDPRTYYPTGDQTWRDVCETNQGIGVGWADAYPYWLEGQWIDITGVAKGHYVLEAEVNAEHVFAEADYSNNSAAVTVRVH